MVMINDFYEKPTNKFMEGYRDFKMFHKNTWNILFHFLTSFLQIHFFIIFCFSFNFYYILWMILIPYLTDGIGHLIEKNFRIVLIMSKFKKSTNSSGVNGFYNFLYKIMMFFELIYRSLKK